MSLPTPEEFARLWEECVDEHDGGAIQDDPTYLRGLIAYIADRDEQVRADEWAQLTEADFVAYGVERGWLSEETIPAFHGFGYTEPAVRRHVTAGEELPPDPPPTPEQIEVLKRRLAGLEP